MTTSRQCPCGSLQPYDECCGRFLDQGAYPQTAEQVMRSRYVAYTQANVAYLTKTWHPDTCPALSVADLKDTQWLRLDVIQHKPGLKKAIVAFNAYFMTDQGEQCMHEVSLFKKLKNRWVYLEAQQN